MSRLMMPEKSRMTHSYSYYFAVVCKFDRIFKITTDKILLYLLWNCDSIYIYINIYNNIFSPTQFTAPSLFPRLTRSATLGSVREDIISWTLRKPRANELQILKQLLVSPLTVGQSQKELHPYILG
jgi:hypothetical protein